MNEHTTPKDSRDWPPEHWLKLLGKMFSLLSGIIRCKNTMTLELLVDRADLRMKPTEEKRIASMWMGRRNKNRISVPSFKPLDHPISYVNY